MAGIGFTLRRLSREKNLLGLARAYYHAAIVATGPWLFTIMALGLIVTFTSSFITPADLYDVKIIMIYNFAFSLVLSGPIVLVATRFVANHIYNRDLRPIPGMMLMSLCMLTLVQLPFVAYFYFFYAFFPLELALAAIANYFVISGIWLVNVMVTSLKDFRTVTWSFASGLLISVVAAVLLGKVYYSIGVLNGFTIGLAVILASLTARILVEYPFKFTEPWKFFSYFPRYWELALGGLIYNMAIWIDKWIMWFAPNSVNTPSLLRMNPNYDSAMFLAYLTIIPALAAFIFLIETEFYEEYVRFYHDVANKATLRRIRDNHQRLLKIIKKTAIYFVVFQGAITLVVILLAPGIISWLNVSRLQIGIFRFAVLGVFYQLMALFLMIVLSYLDNRKLVLGLQLLFLVANIAFTLLSIHLGFAYYGAGYLAACIVTFAVAAYLTIRYMNDLPYHTFITTNTSI